MIERVYDIEQEIETRHLIYSRRNIYIMLENVEINWAWEHDEVKEFDRSLRAGLNIIQLAEKFGRTQEEVGLMQIDRSLKDSNRARKDGSDKYLALETIEIDWFWEMRDVFMFDVYYNMKMSYQTIADKLGRTEAEIIIMTFDRTLQDKLDVDE